MPDTNRRRSSRHLRLLVRATRQIPISASPPLGHAEDWAWWAGAHIRKERECIGHPGPSSGSEEHFSPLERQKCFPDIPLYRSSG